MISFDHDGTWVLWWTPILRKFFLLFDTAIYTLLAIIYEVFFLIADSTILDSDTLKAFYERFYLIIGVFMIFKVSISLIQSVMNPDQLTDKNNGMGQIITRIITMLAMFVAIMPLNIPNATEGSYNDYLNESGLLFGTLYSFQARILKGNVLGKLILGNTATQTSSSSSEAVTESGVSIEESASRFSAYILKSFVRVNKTKYAAENNLPVIDENNNFLPQNSFCSKPNSTTEGIIRAYSKKNATLEDVLPNIDAECTHKKNRWVFVYHPLLSIVCGIVFVVIFFLYCKDIAVRALKLAVLRLLAPIPIISYIDPKSSKDGSFAAWVKAVTSTYLDLFIRLAIIYFVLFIIQSIMEKGLSLPNHGAAGVIATVFIIMGVAIFAKIAPKFIRDSLGLKGSLSNFGLSGFMAAAGAIKEGGNIHDALSASRDSQDAQVAAYNQGKQAPGLGDSYNVGADMMARDLTGNDKMTARQMHRGQRKLGRIGVTAENTDAEKNKMFAMQDDAERAKNLHERVSRGDATEAELQAYAKQNKLTYDNNRKTFTDANGRVTGIRKYTENAYLQAQANAGIQKAKYESMQAEMDKYGGSRNSYRAKYGDLKENRRDVRASDLLTREGRAAMRTGSFGETMRNVASIPGNERLERRNRRIEGEEQRRKYDENIVNQTNARMQNARNQHNNNNNNNNNNP